jgi:16S rRNA (uracil1498-N3)-methyltransferase
MDWMRRFIISPDQLDQPRPYIDGADAHHLRVVLRSQPGDMIDVLDGMGNAYRAQVVSIDRDRVYVALEAPLSADRESVAEMILAQGYLKDKKMDGLVRQLTELGVARWIPFVAKRSVPVPDEKRLLARYARWQKISLEALKQCGRRCPMVIDPLVSFEGALEQARFCNTKLIFYEKISESESRALMPTSRADKVFAMIGPEGGFDPDEVALARQAGFLAVGMGPRILRAETATLAAAVLMQFVFGDMAQNCP